MLKGLIVLVAIIAVFAVVVATRPADFRVERSTTIAAPPAAVFAQVNDLHAFNVWNPFAKLDPAMTQTYEGSPSGPGQTYRWSGNSQAGEGRMTIVESRPSELIRMELEFTRPFAATNTAEFTFAPAAGGTTVTWAMIGRNNFIAKAMSMFMDMDKMVGGEFEKGLADLKSLTEKSARS